MITNLRVPENARAGYIFAQLSTIDPDRSTQRHTYEVVHTVAGIKPFFEIQGANSLAVARQLDHESYPKVQISVKVTDQGGMSYEKLFSVTVDGKLFYNNFYHCRSSLEYL